MFDARSMTHAGPFGGLRLTTHVFVVLITVVFATRADAGVIQNGNFQSTTPLDGWTVSGTNDALSAEVLEPTGNFAQLETDGSFLRTLEQGFCIPNLDATLSFDFAFSTMTSANVSGFPNSFGVSVVTDPDLDYLELLVVDVTGLESFGFDLLNDPLPPGIDFDDTVTIDGFQPFVGGTTFSGRMSIDLPSSVLGEDATIYFDLFDQSGDPNLTLAAFDNVSLGSAAVIPEPASLAIWVLSIGGFVFRRRSRARAL